MGLYVPLLEFNLWEGVASRDEMDIWNVAQQIGHAGKPLSGSVSKLLADLPIVEYLNASGALFAKAGPVTASMIIAYIYSGVRLRNEQRSFWQDIVPEGYLRNCGVVIGGGGRIDLVRGDKIPKAVQWLLLRASLPVLTGYVDGFQNLEAHLFQTPFPKYRPVIVPTLRSLADIVGQIFGRHIRFRERLSIKTRNLLVVPQGPVSNDLAHKHLVNTANRRKYHMIAKPPSDNGPPRILSNYNDMEQVRQIKDRQLWRAHEKPGLASDESVLDGVWQYEIWKSDDPGHAGPNCGERLVTPHSSSDEEFIHDAILIIVSKALDDNLPNTTWIFSVQPLHALAAMAIELFWHPNAMLGYLASSFVKDARKAMKDSKGIGFEAVLSLKCKRSVVDGESPRVFRRQPILQDIVFEVVGAPRPLIRE